MAKPPTSVRSIRLPDALWEKLTERAAETGTSVNALVAGGAEMAVTVLVHRSDIEFAAKYTPPADILARSKQLTARTVTENLRQFKPHPKPTKKR